ncbi:MAG TPA: nucleotide exchange factor GrpE [Spirochaetota bacterium]|nr:nucleotide exchange factor GrpE [Spirochaetota bacterium]HOM38479.1 nucleotide exchange factor GrpE [Spirochaetota bacterium]HPQ49019.1 nucleotide exchange factor GrpE [Spirochaetota bacterium]
MDKESIKKDNTKNNSEVLMEDNLNNEKKLDEKNSIDENNTDEKDNKKEENKNDEIITKIQELETKLKEYEELIKRKVADFDNLRKRTIEEKKVLNQILSEKIILDFLPIIDNLERAINAAKETKDIDALLNGISLIKDMFLSILSSNYNVKPIDSIGKEFDPKIHNALYQKEGDYDKIIVVEEIEKPYIMGEKVIRIGKVGVGTPKEKKVEEKENEEKK